MSATAQSAVTKSVFRKFIDSPAGPKTIHFWAPAMKWVRALLSLFRVYFRNELTHFFVVRLWLLLELEICNVLLKN